MCPSGRNCCSQCVSCRPFILLHCTVAWARGRVVCLRLLLPMPAVVPVLTVVGLSLGFFLSSIYLQLTFDVGVVTIFGRRLADHVKEKLRENYLIVEKGYNSFPNPVPFTSYSQAIKVRTRTVLPSRPILFLKRTTVQGQIPSSLRHNVDHQPRLLFMHACRRGAGWP